MESLTEFFFLVLATSSDSETGGPTPEIPDTISGPGSIIGPLQTNGTPSPAPTKHINRGAARQMYGSGQLRPPGQISLIQQMSNDSTLPVGAPGVARNPQQGGKGRQGSYEAPPPRWTKAEVPSLYPAPLPFVPRYPGDNIESRSGGRVLRPSNR